MSEKITVKFTASDEFDEQLDEMRRAFFASKEKWRTALVVGRTVNEAKTIWKRVKADYPSYKYTKFVSRNPCGIDGINAENATLYVLPGYTENPIVKDSHFRWVIKLAAEVTYVEDVSTRIGGFVTAEEMREIRDKLKRDKNTTYRNELGREECADEHKS